MLEAWWTTCITNISKQCSLVLKACVIYILTNLWETRNFEIFRGEVPKILITIHMINSQLLLTGSNTKATTSSSMVDFKILKVFNIVVRPPSAPVIKEVFWLPLPIGWAKCSCCDAYQHNSLSIDCSGIFRDHLGNYILTFAKEVSLPSHFAEFVAMVNVMKIAVDKGWLEIWLETDFVTVVQSFSNPSLILWHFKN